MLQRNPQDAAVAEPGGEGRGMPSALLRHAQVLGAGIADLVLPPQCASCGERTAGTRGLCTECWGRLDFIDGPVCPRTGRPFVYDPGPGIVSAAALARASSIDRVRGAVRFDDVARDLVHALKYRDRHETAEVMVRLMARAGAELLRDADVLVPVPLHRRRLWQRRYNQSVILAHRLARGGDGVRADPTTLERGRPTRAQGGLNMAERRRNVKGAFELRKKAVHRVSGRSCLIIDDVWTTGATVEACARALLAGGASGVDVLVFALVCSPVTPGQ